MVGKFLKQFSQDKGINQKEVAKKLKYSAARVNNYYRDIAKPPREFYDRFRSEFHIDLKKLIDEEKNGFAPSSLSNKSIPVYDLELKPVNDPNFMAHDELIVNYVVIPMFNDCAALIKVFTRDMSPNFEPNELLAIREIKNIDLINLGGAFIVITEEQKFLRYVRANEKDNKSYILRASNIAGHDNIVVKKADIKHLYEVKGRISRV